MRPGTRWSGHEPLIPVRLIRTPAAPGASFNCLHLISHIAMPGVYKLRPLVRAGGGHSQGLELHDGVCDSINESPINH